MMRAVTPLTLLLLAACDGGASRVAADGYAFGEPEYTQETFTVTMVQYDSDSSFTAAAREYGADKEGLQAFGLLSRDRQSCEIHIRRIADAYRPEWLGHELAHCIHGRWHK